MQVKEIRHDTTDVAKIVRRELKQRWPGVKFRVRSRRYSGGSSVDVSWFDGPTSDQVHGVTSRYEGADFDGMIDLKTHRPATLIAHEDGTYENVRYGADWINGNRRESAAVLRKLAVEVAEFAGLEELPQVRDSEYGASLQGPLADLRLDVSAHGYRGQLGCGLARDDHQGDYFSSLARALWTFRDYSTPCDHVVGTYPAGGGWHRCRGCGMKSRRPRSEADPA